MRLSALAMGRIPWHGSIANVNRSGRKRLWKVPQLWKSATNADSHQRLGKHKTLSTLPTVSALVQLTNGRSLNNDADRSLANKSGHLHLLKTVLNTRWIATKQLGQAEQRPKHASPLPALKHVPRRYLPPSAVA